MIVRPLPPTQSKSNTIRPTSQYLAPPTAFAKAQAHQVYSTAISTLSTLCLTPKPDDKDPKIIPRSATVCPRLNPIAAIFTHSQPGVPTGVRVLSMLLPPLRNQSPRACSKVITRSRMLSVHSLPPCGAGLAARNHLRHLVMHRSSPKGHAKRY